jgi:hypothetical protein
VKSAPSCEVLEVDGDIPDIVEVEGVDSYLGRLTAIGE